MEMRTTRPSQFRCFPWKKLAVVGLIISSATFTYGEKTEPQKRLKGRNRRKLSSNIFWDSLLVDGPVLSAGLGNGKGGTGGKGGIGGKGSNKYGDFNGNKCRFREARALPDLVQDLPLPKSGPVMKGPLEDLPKQILKLPGPRLPGPGPGKLPKSSTDGSPPVDTPNLATNPRGPLQTPQNPAAPAADPLGENQKPPTVGRPKPGITPDAVGQVTPGTPLGPNQTASDPIPTPPDQTSVDASFNGTSLPPFLPVPPVSNLTDPLLPPPNISQPLPIALPGDDEPVPPFSIPPPLSQAPNTTILPPLAPGADATNPAPPNPNTTNPLPPAPDDNVTVPLPDPPLANVTVPPPIGTDNSPPENTTPTPPVIDAPNPARAPIGPGVSKSTPTPLSADVQIPYCPDWMTRSPDATASGTLAPSPLNGPGSAPTLSPLNGQGPSSGPHFGPSAYMPSAYPQRSPSDVGAHSPSATGGPAWGQHPSDVPSVPPYPVGPVLIGGHSQSGPTVPTYSPAPTYIITCEDIANGLGPTDYTSIGFTVKFVLIISGDHLQTLYNVQRYLQKHVAPSLVGCQARRRRLIEYAIRNVVFGASEDTNTAPICQECTNVDVDADFYYVGQNTSSFGSRLYDALVSSCADISNIDGVNATFDPCPTITITPKNSTNQGEVAGIQNGSPARKGITLAGSLSILFAGLLLLMLGLLFAITQRRDESYLMKHRQLDEIDDDENIYLDDAEVRTEPSSPGSPDKDLDGPPRVHIVGEEESIFSGWTDNTVASPGGTKSSVRRDLAGLQLRGDSPSFKADVHFCSSATCEICESRRQSGLEFIPTTMPGHSASVPIEGTRAYVIRDTVTL